MGKFLNKKEQVIDLKITSYGKHLLGAGTMKPVYYVFYDDNVIYDGTYAGRSETQNEIQHRIKNDTQYLEGQVLFQDIEKLPNPNNLLIIEEVLGEQGEVKTPYAVRFQSDIEPINNLPRNNIYKLEHMIGDAFLEGNTQNIPAWKLVTIQGKILSSSANRILMRTTSSAQDVIVPQIEMQLNYKLKIKDSSELNTFGAEDVFDGYNIEDSFLFADSKFIALETDDLLLYAEEINTIMLNENFDVEVFEFDNNDPDKLIRKNFDKDYKSLNGEMITEDYIKNVQKTTARDYGPSDVAYYFDVLKDEEVDNEAACKGAEIYNKNSYYIDLDFECTTDTDTSTAYYDIYGPVTEPEICQ